MTPYYDEDGITIWHADCREVDLLPGFSLVAFDPPYNVGKDYGPGFDDKRLPAAYGAWITEALRRCGSLGDHLVYFPGTVNVPACFGWLGQSGWTLNRQLGWHKKEYAGDLFGGGPAMSWEPIMWATTAGSERQWNKVFGAYGRDFLVVPSTHGDPLRAEHPCPKPPEVLRWLIGLFCPPGGSVLDPMMGTGTALVAAKLHGRRAVGVERSERYCEIAARRLAQGVLFSDGAAS